MPLPYQTCHEFKTKLCRQANLCAFASKARNGALDEIAAQRVHELMYIRPWQREF